MREGEGGGGWGERGTYDDSRKVVRGEDEDVGVVGTHDDEERGEGGRMLSVVLSDDKKGNENGVGGKAKEGQGRMWREGGVAYLLGSRDGVLD